MPSNGGIEWVITSKKQAQKRIRTIQTLIRKHTRAINRETVMKATLAKEQNELYEKWILGFTDEEIDIM